MRLPVIVLAQFCCTSVWFAGNAVLNDLGRAFALSPGAVGNLTSAVQFGFISGTLLFAVLAVADRFSTSRVFFVAALVGALCNLSVVWEGNGFGTLLAGRFGTGFCLAGIYPVGMKIAADHYQRGLGKSLGFLVGALVLGTAFPHLLRGVGQALPWRNIIWFTSAIAVGGGALMLALVPDGPYRSRAAAPQFTAFFQVFRHRPFRAAAFGYFGHMWELYTFWAFLPFLLAAYGTEHPEVGRHVSLWSFAVIGSGGVACVAGGYLSQRWGTRRTAAWALSLSGACCLLLPWCYALPPSLFMSFLLCWGMFVVADSPLFSTLVASSAEPELKGTALTIVNCIGFAVTIVSLQVLGWAGEWLGPLWRYVLLALGPVAGLWGLFGRGRGSKQGSKEQ